MAQFVAKKSQTRREKYERVAYLMALMEDIRKEEKLKKKRKSSKSEKKKKSKKHKKKHS
jgi:hypothetical protein